MYVLWGGGSYGRTDGRTDRARGHSPDDGQSIVSRSKYKGEVMGRPGGSGVVRTIHIYLGVDQFYFMAHDVSLSAKAFGHGHGP
jgi:hypothetical protein